MKGSDIIKTIVNSPSILGQIYSDLASPSVKAIGKALGTVFEYGTNFLLPLKLQNEKAKATFAHNLETYKKKLNSIPEKERCEVHPQVGTPIVDKLTYTTNEDIADMFTSLLASDSDNRTKQFVHPSFVGIIENLSPDEARIIKYFKGKETIEFCSFRGILKSNGGFQTLLDHVTNIPSEVELLYSKNIGAYISNLVRLGFLVEPQGVHLNDKTGYDQIRKTYGLEKMRKELDLNLFKSLKCIEGYYLVTPFGKLFIEAVFPER